MNLAKVDHDSDGIDNVAEKVSVILMADFFHGRTFSLPFFLSSSASLSAIYQRVDKDGD